jgi:ferrochelatase
MSARYDAILIVAFGGPERRDDVIPFLENVLRGRNVPRERLLSVAEHYYHFDGVSPINQQVRELIAALQDELDRSDVKLPIYWGNRNWHPLLADTVAKMRDDGVKHALAVVLSSYSSYSGCRQYRENIADARAAVGDSAPRIDKLRVWYNHPDFVKANAERLAAAIDELPAEMRSTAYVAFTAHSVPQVMAETSDYVRQLSETCRLVAGAVGVPETRRRLVYQSPSGRPQDPWLEPDINQHLEQLRDSGAKAVVIAPIGFLSDHMEVLYDLDFEARETANRLGLTMARARTVGTHPKFVAMLRELIVERASGSTERCAVGRFGANHDVCPLDCCPSPAIAARQRSERAAIEDSSAAESAGR